MSVVWEYLTSKRKICDFQFVRHDLVMFQKEIQQARISDLIFLIDFAFIFN